MQSCSGETSCFLSPPGGGSGIGRSVCQRFASEGASVVVADISEESANETLGSLSSDLRGQGHMAAVVDVSSKESVKKLVASIQVCVCVCVVQTENTPTHTHSVHYCHNVQRIQRNTHFFSLLNTRQNAAGLLHVLFVPLCVFCSQLISSPSADSLLSASLGVCERSRHHTGRLPAQHGGGPVWQSHPGQPEGTQPGRPVAPSQISELFSHLWAHCCQCFPVSQRWLTINWSRSPRNLL